MANEKHLQILLQGVETWNNWRQRWGDEWLNLSRVDLRGFDLRNADLRGCRLDLSDLSGSDLRGANLRHADLSMAKLCNANMNGCYLFHTTVDEADFSGAKMIEVTFSDDLEGRKEITLGKFMRCDLTRANFCNVHFDMVSFKEAILTDADFEHAEFDGGITVFEKARIQNASFRNAWLVGANMAEADFRQADLYMANLAHATLSDADLRGARLLGCMLVETNLEGANISGCSVYGVSAWSIVGTPKEQNNLNISPERQPPIYVDDIEVAQFIFLLLNHKKLRQVVNAVTQKGVLLLGRFSDGGLENLQAIAQKLREQQYLPILFDFDRPDQRDYTETVKTLAWLSRFIIVDLSGPSIPQELHAIAPHVAVPIFSIIQNGYKPYSMFADLLKYPWIKSPIQYDNTDALLQVLSDKILEPAEAYVHDRQTQLKNLLGG